VKNKYILVALLILTSYTLLVAQVSFHIVRNNDTIASIADQYNINLLDLCEYNGFPATFTPLKYGQWVWLEPGHASDYQAQIEETETLAEEDEIGLFEEEYCEINEDPTTATFVEEQPVKLKAITPVSYVRIYSEFGYRRGRMHYGIDFASARGTPICAVLPGRVKEAKYSRTYGNVVVIEHEDNQQTVYAHNTSNIVRTGDLVEQGQVIAYVGRTGRATGPHLHFEYRQSNMCVNPRLLLVDLP